MKLKTKLRLLIAANISLIIAGSYLIVNGNLALGLLLNTVNATLLVINMHTLFSIPK